LDVGPEGSVRGFLYKVARNLIVDRTRRADVRERSVLSTPLPRADPLQDAIGGDFEAALADALASLPPRRRDAIVLVRLQGLSLKEAAEAMDVTPRTVANHIYLAGTDLAEALRRYL
jgi:RNA polymerase sigma-70 factor (ECF subfamily)